MKGSAVFSSCGRYRYALWRHWGGPGGTAMIVGLNPSTADAMHDDPTIRRCIGFARDWGYSGLCMTNLFAYRATKPRDLMAADDPAGPDNDAWLVEQASRAALVVASWGMHGAFGGRDCAVRALLPPLACLGLTRQGQPRHPLYLRRECRPVPWHPMLSLAR
ncbi:MULTISPECIES: DUF1643 domain-containing protein [unclassified Thiocapsa]|uniref:DUF1643 domain-containing protein n=1 Tax=unclassified Thiocapsa TaxID=2641286 RepID=UPI0035ADE2A0